MTDDNEEQNSAKDSKTRSIRKTWTERYTPYYKSRIEAQQETKIALNDNVVAGDGFAEVKASGVEENGDTDILTTDCSSITSPLVSHSSTDDTISRDASITSTSVEGTSKDDLCPTFTSTGTINHDVFQVCHPLV